MDKYQFFIFNGYHVHVRIGNRILFFMDHVAKAVGFSKKSSIWYHIKDADNTHIDRKWMDIRGIRLVASKATRTPMMDKFAEEAYKFVTKITVSELNKKPVLGKSKELIGITEAANKLGMSTPELSNWLVAEGYAGRYISNNAIHWKSWFKKQGYGTLPKINGDRTSNVAKLTNAGVEFIQNRLSSQRESNVLAFASSEHNERVKLEQEFDNLVLRKFIGYKHNFSPIFSNDDHEYRIEEKDLLIIIKSIIAQVKLKGKE